MPVTTRPIIAICKFQVESVEEQADQEIIKLSALYDENDPEDTKFSKYTPWGSVEFGVSNPNVMGQFKVGDAFFVHFTRVDEEAKWVAK